MAFAKSPPPRLFRKEFSPVMEPGDMCILLQQSGLFVDPSGPSARVPGQAVPWWRCTAVEALPALGIHGVVVIWSHSAAPPAPYILDPQGASGSIASSGVVAAIVPKALVVLPRELLQLRFRVKFIGAFAAGLAADDFDFRASQPGATRRWSVQNSLGSLNVMDQVQNAADSIVAPAQGANIALPAVFPSEDAWEAAWRSQLFTYQDLSPAFDIVNNGSVATAAGMAIGLQVSGYRYALAPMTRGAGWRDIPFEGVAPAIAAPPQIADVSEALVIQIAGRAPTLGG